MGLMPITPSYYSRLGLFVEKFAEVEEILYEFLRRLTGLDHATARAVISGAKIKVEMDFVRSIYNARGQEFPESLNKAFIQLTEINTVRNLLLHHGTVYQNRKTENGVVSKRIASDATRKLRNPKRLEVSPEFLLALFQDLDVIMTVIKIHDGMRFQDSSAEEYLEKFRRFSWRCKFPVQESKNQPTLNSSRKHRRPQRSSLA